MPSKNNNVDNVLVIKYHDDRLDINYSIKGDSVNLNDPNIYSLLSNLINANNTQIGYIPSVENMKGHQVLSKLQTESNNINLRSDRLPNNIDEPIDLKKLDVKDSKSTFHKNFMCPHCRQWMTIKINGSLIMKDVVAKDKTNYQISSEGAALIKSNKDILNMEGEEISSLIEASDVGIVNNEYLDGQCIQCGKNAPVKDWVDTYNKNKSILTDICPICGGEMIYDTNKKKYICDTNHCIEIEVEE